MKCRFSQCVAILLVGLPGPAAPAQSAPPDEALWRQIESLASEPPTTQPFEPRFEQAIAQRRTLLEKLRAYLSMYPGGPNRDAAIRLELNALFELGSLAGGAFDALCLRTQELLDSPPSPSAQEEAAYWQILCDRWRETNSASQPATEMQLGEDPRLLAACKRYVSAYPASRHSPRMSTLLFEAALRQGDLLEMRRIVEALSQQVPDHATSLSLAGQLRREETVGKPFAISFPDSQGNQVDTSTWRGRPGLVVAWASFEPAAVQMLREVNEAQRGDRELRVAGVNLDDRVEDMRRIVEQLQVDWPQWHDGFGWASAFAREWGVRSVPRVFVISRDGRLLGTATDGRWRELLRQAQQN